MIDPAAVFRATACGAGHPSSGVTRQSRRISPSLVHSTQETTADPSCRSSVSTRPAASPPSMRNGASKLAPLSREKATLTAGSLCAAVNQATTASLPSASIAGPFTGQPEISQPSA
ncbi:hypothetical protein ACSQ8B_01635 [Marinovum sp. F03]|uniref:hypothetical protein n=1 Tax=Marinovum sp. F03 TaxID=3449226 RepID=UPI003EDBF420